MRIGGECLLDLLIPLALLCFSGFGCALGLLISGRKVNVVVCMVLVILSIGAIGILGLLLIGNAMSIIALVTGQILNIELEGGLIPGTYFFLWFVPQFLPIILLFAVGFLAGREKNRADEGELQDRSTNPPETLSPRPPNIKP